MNKKKIITLTMLLLIAVANMNAQVFIMSDEEYNNERLPEPGSCDLPSVPILDITYDQYAPLGGGVFMLGLLGGAYLLDKRKKDE